MFEKIKRFYNIGLYTKVQVKKFVEKNKITLKEYKIITGEDYNI